MKDKDVILTDKYLEENVADNEGQVGRSTWEIQMTVGL